MNWRTAPLPVIWPNGQRTPYTDRKRAQFKTASSRTMALLTKEIQHLMGGWVAAAGEEVVICAGYQPHEIRQDGMPRANARPADPAVVVQFKSKHGPLTYACDTFTSYDDNLRAIALGLEALRTVDRYGITRSGAQYTGFKALASGESTVAAGVAVLPPMTDEEAATFIRNHSRIGDQTAGLNDHYRSAARSLHPDNGGARRDWNQLQEAKAVLGL